MEHELHNVNKDIFISMGREKTFNEIVDNFGLRMTKSLVPFVE